MPTAKKVKKLDPKKLFVISTVSRETIADMLNGANEMVGKDIEEFTPNDPRLTDEVCQAIADDIYDAMGNIDANDYVEQDAYTNALDRF